MTHFSFKLKPASRIGAGLKFYIRKRGKMMEKKNNSLIIGGIMAVVAVFLILVVKIIVPVCTGMVETAAGKQVPMRCHYTSAALLVLGILLLVNAVLCIVKKEKIVCGVMAVVISAFIFLVLGSTLGMGVCANPEMACNMTAPFAKLAGGLGVLVGAVSVYMGVKDEKR